MSFIPCTFLQYDFAERSKLSGKHYFNNFTFFGGLNFKYIYKKKYLFFFCTRGQSKVSSFENESALYDNNKNSCCFWFFTICFGPFSIVFSVFGFWFYIFAEEKNVVLRRREEEGFGIDGEYIDQWW